ncbi:MAG: threonine-phosphate decarboxylase [Ferrovum sp.]|nr:threonine-phosphate decarboxylase [Ferrovum sp.]
MPNHGGGILTASRCHGIPVESWLDLSTGLNPLGWPVPAVPERVWLRLPEIADGLENAAAGYYGCSSLLPVAGSQCAIQILPRLRAPSSVGVLEITYAEHPHAWARWGHQVVRVKLDELDAAADTLDALIICNPNNPTGSMLSPERMENWRKRLIAHGGWLVVDEAFMDVTPEYSMIPQVGQPGLVVLRSLGKFFGLAGARVGFVLAWPELLGCLQDEIGPWTVNGPGRYVAQKALADLNWQEMARNRVIADSGRLAGLLTSFDLAPTGGTMLFQWMAGSCATALHEFLARKGILTRYFPEPQSVRFGLPKTPEDWLRLSAALHDFVEQNERV